MKVIKEEKFRSEPKVNTSYDMVRVTVDMTLNEYRKFQNNNLTPQNHSWQIGDTFDTADGSRCCIIYHAGARIIVDVFDDTTAIVMSRDGKVELREISCPNELKKYVRELLELLEQTETSEFGREFHPTRIESCRSEHIARLAEIMPKLKELSE